MALPQPGIFALGTNSHAYLEFDLVEDVDPSAAVSLAAGLREPRTTIGGVNLVTGFRPELWAAVAPDAAPEDVSGFNQPLIGPDGYTFPATQHDIVMWLAGAGYDVVFDLSRQIVKAVASFAKLARETVGWPYHHDRDLTGFIDGTKNPSLVVATEVAIIPSGERGEGGSILLLQQWEHDALAWESLPAEVQERVMGRRSPTAPRSNPTRRPRMWAEPTRIVWARSSGATWPTAQSKITGRCSSASARAREFLTRCFKRCSVQMAGRATTSPTSRAH